MPTLPFAVSLTPDYGARSSANAEKLSALPLFPIVIYLRAPQAVNSASPHTTRISATRTFNAPNPVNRWSR